MLVRGGLTVRFLRVRCMPSWRNASSDYCAIVPGPNAGHTLATVRLDGMGETVAIGLLGLQFRAPDLESQGLFGSLVKRGHA